MRMTVVQRVSEEKVINGRPCRVTYVVQMGSIAINWSLVKKGQVVTLPTYRGTAVMPDAPAQAIFDHLTQIDLRVEEIMLPNDHGPMLVLVARASDVNLVRYVPGFRAGDR